MVRGVVGLAAVAAALAALPAATAFRVDPPPPMDVRPEWSPDDSAIVFSSSRSNSLRVVPPGGGRPDHALPVGYGELSPDWRWIAFTDFQRAPPSIELVHPDGSGHRTVAVGSNFDWAPDSERLVFQRQDESGRVDLFSVRTDGTDVRRLIVDGEVPRWSRDGRWIAFRRLRAGRVGTDVGIARADGNGARIVPSRIFGGYDATSMEWSPDGATLALFSFTRSDRSLYLVRTRDLRVRRVGLPVVARGGEFSPDGRTIVYEGEGIWLFDVRTGHSTRLARFGAEPDWSRNGRAVAFAGGGRCGDRSGIYSIPVWRGTLTRLTNDCRIVGSDGPDTLRGGEFSDVLVGRDGADELIAYDDFYYEGDRLEGGSGDDRLVGSNGTDILVGGPGRDEIRGGAAHDRVFALDGERDVISCGGPHTGGRLGDTVYADKVDVVAPDCEFVYRPGAPLVGTSFSVRLWPRGEPGPSRRWSLACEPVRGTLPGRERACARLGKLLDPFAAFDAEAVCPRKRAERPVARIDGRFRGRRFTVRLKRLDGCEIGRWDRLGFLFPRLP
jgi:dipeptidyl aminopeptidase/acylaminoacyl peptidase